MSSERWSLKSNTLAAVGLSVVWTCTGAPAFGSSLEGIDPMEKLTPAGAHLFGDLCSSELSAGGHAHGQEALMGFDILTHRQRGADGESQVGSPQVMPFRHSLFAHRTGIVQLQTVIGIRGLEGYGWNRGRPENNFISTVH
jgi:hypothetical protein